MMALRCSRSLIAVADDFQHEPLWVLPEHRIIAGMILRKLLGSMEHWGSECLDLRMHGMHGGTRFDHKGEMLQSRAMA